MNTFLSYSDYNKSAKCLDVKRLGKQRPEVWQIYLALTKENYGWKNHPAVKMWKNCEKSLLKYGILICKEWISRGYKDTMLDKFINEYNKFPGIEKPPDWLGNEEFHAAMRSNLLRKNFEYYKQFGWKEPNNLPYIWGIK